MFKDIGYQLIENNDEYISYYRKDADGMMWIEFELENKKFCVDRNDRPEWATVSEFKAIQQQLKELEWI